MSGTFFSASTKECNRAQDLMLWSKSHPCCEKAAQAERPALSWVSPALKGRGSVGEARWGRSNSRNDVAMWPRRDPNRQNAIARKKETLRGKWNKTHWLRMSIAVTRGNKTQMRFELLSRASWRGTWWCILEFRGELRRDSRARERLTKQYTT